MIFRNRHNTRSLDKPDKPSIGSVHRVIAPGDFDFKELFKANYPMVLRHATFIVSDKAAAEDIAQETFIKLYERPPKEFTNLSAWLLTVATNIAYNYLRSEKSRKRREEAEVRIEEGFDQNVETIEKLTDAERVRELLLRLDDRDRVCLVLKFSGFS
ncbi:MAG: sigma-70 family RNA polymerase sigma factor, partial [Rubrobacteridae bacterium]|nr:sigma-70 family RNA polymerase sigma factor [Rubrobacteridae bacterium]